MVSFIIGLIFIVIICCLITKTILIINIFGIVLIFIALTNMQKCSNKAQEYTKKLESLQAEREKLMNVDSYNKDLNLNLFD